MTHTIKLFIDNGHWMATFSEPEIVELFGTDTIETAFMAAASAERVLSEIQALNPDCNVTIATCELLNRITHTSFDSLFTAI